MHVNSDADDAERNIWVIIPAAGRGRRMGDAALPKQYQVLAGRTVIEWSAAPFLRSTQCQRIVVVVAPDDPHWTSNPLREEGKVVAALGGEQRADSVKAGLAALAQFAAADDWVLVHDAARPCLSDQELERLIAQVRLDAVGGILASAIVDTVKRGNDDGGVLETLPREGLWRALTPQMFRFGVLTRALELVAARGISVSDESQAIELLGLQPRLVTGNTDNLKITRPDDLTQAARILAARGER